MSLRTSLQLLFLNKCPFCFIRDKNLPFLNNPIKLGGYFETERQGVIVITPPMVKGTRSFVLFTQLRTVIGMYVQT